MLETTDVLIIICGCDDFAKTFVGRCSRGKVGSVFKSIEILRSPCNGEIILEQTPSRYRGICFHQGTPNSEFFELQNTTVESVVQ